MLSDTVDGVTVMHIMDDHETNGKREPRAGSSSPNIKRAVYTIDEFAKLLGIGRNTAYEAARRGDIPTIRVKSRYIVPLFLAEQYLHGTWKPKPQSSDAAFPDFASYLWKWLRAFTDDQPPADTKSNYQRAIEVWIIPTLGSLTLGAISPHQIRRAIEKWRLISHQQNSSAWLPISRIYGVLDESLDDARIKGLIAVNPLRCVDPP
jgi:excisionase family DNA binding protein